MKCRQRAAPKIAGRAMFSLNVRRYVPGLRGRVVWYCQKFGRPYLLDMLQPTPGNEPSLGGGSRSRRTKRGRHA